MQGCKAAFETQFKALWSSGARTPTGLAELTQSDLHQWKT